MIIANSRIEIMAVSMLQWVILYCSTRQNHAIAVISLYLYLFQESIKTYI